MRKTIIFTVLLLLLTSVCMAQTNNDRWCLVTSDNIATLYYDTQTVQYNKDRTECDVWIMFVFPNEGIFNNTALKVYVDRKILQKDVYTYNLQTGALLCADPRTDDEYISIPPASRFEMLYNKLFPNKTK